MSVAGKSVLVWSIVLFMGMGVLLVIALIAFVLFIAFCRRP
jgi:hypothetical protein